MAAEPLLKYQATEQAFDAVTEALCFRMDGFTPPAKKPGTPADQNGPYDNDLTAEQKAALRAAAQQRRESWSQS